MQFNEIHRAPSTIDEEEGSPMDLGKILEKYNKEFREAEEEEEGYNNGKNNGVIE